MGHDEINEFLAEYSEQLKNIGYNPEYFFNRAIDYEIPPDLAADKILKKTNSAFPFMGRWAMFICNLEKHSKNFIKGGA